jgi:hypothetical protein
MVLFFVKETLTRTPSAGKFLPKKPELSGRTLARRGVKFSFVSLRAS